MVMCHQARWQSLNWGVLPCPLTWYKWESLTSPPLFIETVLTIDEIWDCKKRHLLADYTFSMERIPDADGKVDSDLTEPISDYKRGELSSSEDDK